MDAIESFFQMGGYAGYVWPAFALTAAVMGGLLVASLRDLRQQRRTLSQLEATLPRRRRRGGAREEAVS